MKRYLFIVYFFLSGMCGLIYQVVWVRMFGLVVGVTIYAFTTVVVAFMAGLALGGYLGGRYADRTGRDPLKVYGLLEGAIGIYALVIPFLIMALDPIFSFFYQHLEQSSMAFLLMRFLICGLVLIVPTTMMGATLPILVRHSYAGQEHFGWTTGRLYAVNTIGAVLGSFISGFYLIPRLGQNAATYTAAGFNIMIFAVIFALHREKRPAEERPGVMEALSEKLKPLGAAGLVLLVGYGLSGAAAMSYQVAWTKALILSIGVSMYAIGLILTAFISGLGIGGAAMSPFADRIKRPFLWAAVMEMIIAVSAVAVVPIMGKLPLWMYRIPTISSYNRELALKFLVAFALIFIPTILMGALLPLVCRIYQEKRGGAGRAIGQIYSANTLGAVLGTFLTGIILISLLGIKNTILLASVLNFLIGAAFILVGELRRAAGLAVIAASAVILGLSLGFTPSWNPGITSLAPYVYQSYFNEMGLDREQLFEVLPSAMKVEYYNEGPDAVITVSRDVLTDSLTLRINGKADASDSDDMPTQVLCGHLPMLLHENPEKVMILGLASGVSLGALTLHPARSIDCLELSPEVVEASHFFDDINNNPLSDPRVNLIVNDGRHHLAYTENTYDVIISEPSNPWISGMGILFTREFFELARERLNKGGIFLCWLEIYDLDDEMIRLFIRTFGEVFPEMSLWETIPGSDYFLVGFKEKFEINLGRYISNSSNPGIIRDIQRIGEDDPARILAKFLMGPERLAELAGPGPVHTDDRREMEYIVPKRKRNRTYTERLNPFFKRLSLNLESLTPYIGPARLPEEKDFLARVEDYEKSRDHIIKSMIAFTDSPPRREEAFWNIERAWEIIPGNYSLKDDLVDYYFSRADASLGMNRYQDAAEYLTKIISTGYRDTLVLDSMGKMAYDSRQIETARNFFESSLKIDPENPRALFMIGTIQLDTGLAEQAKTSLEAAIKYFPPFREKEKVRQYSKNLSNVAGWAVDVMALEKLGQLEMMQGNFTVAEMRFRKALSISDDFERARLGLAAALTRQGRAREAEAEYLKLLQKNPDSLLGHFYLGRLLIMDPARKREAKIHLRKALEIDPDFPAAESIREMLKK